MTCAKYTERNKGTIPNTAPNETKGQYTNTAPNGTIISKGTIALNIPNAAPNETIISNINQGQLR